ncbi:hypothetical protein A1O7_08513 [Cladophialophora yegresii CBS 114405]|uniref:Uncharacterized protein n=1 Tax=Cladophialophora yegresii CBS 114405 TaxID=1182544 RepID=W9VRE0_9EURO|nr:uncharacterized protein A1O7_08513 [Cladophialophora yegresii CBS 114405]EXJ55585.1 hypothetical protein A1O7_08513 [Cladophialophora yegresii CBS 114405]
MKDILIHLQQDVISHLREVFMDEAALDLHMLKETSDDCQVNATVCLGQLYQRMSTATAAMKQMARPYVDEPDKVQLPASLAYSSSRSTHSSYGGRPYDLQSTGSYTTYSSRTAIGHDHKASGGLTPQRRISMNSTLSYSSEPPKIRTPGEDNVPALPFAMQQQPSHGAVQTTSDLLTHNYRPQERVLSPSAGPPPYQQDLLRPVYTTDDKGQRFPPDSSFYQPPPIDVQKHVAQSPPLQPSPRLAPEMNESGATTPAHAHELDTGPPAERPTREEGSTVPSFSPQSPPLSQRQAVPVNPDYPTLEFVATTNSRGRPPPPSIPSIPEYQYQQQQVQQSMPVPYQHQQQPVSRQPIFNSPISRPQPSSAEAEALPAPTDPLFHQRVPPIHSAPRPLSIRSTSSTGSKIASFAIRKGLPPGIADAIHKPSSGALEAQFNGQPRYVRPKPLDFSNGREGSQVASPTSPIAQQIDSMLEGMTTKSASASVSTADNGSLEAKMRLSGVPIISPDVQISRSQLNIPSESNLAGFCKGAVRQQLGARKKGFTLEHKRGLKGHEYFWRCSKCNFEGPAAVSKALPSGGRGSAKVEKTMDTTVRRSAGGIKYRWNLLAKCHVSKKLTIGDALNSGDIFACYFCCAEGAAKGWLDNGVTTQLANLGVFGEKKATAVNVTPTFSALDAFLAHLDTHRLPNRTPGLIVANEMNCIIGRVALDHEDFDLNLPP